MVKSDRFRDGIININTRQFGTAAEVIIKILKNCIDSKKLEFDLIDIDRNKIEVKASKVYRKQTLDLDITTFYDLILNNSNRDRLLLQSETLIEEFDCNIQQIKIKLFDKLIYLLFFKDIIEIFEIDSSKIKKDKAIAYSDIQHRGNIGEGQFHVNNRTYKYHKENYFIQSITYQELMIEAKKHKRK